MLINHTAEYDEVWDKVYSVLGFKPSCMYRGHSLKVELPFKINMPYIVYSIESMNDNQLDIMDDLIRECLVNCSEINDEWYALDWQHSAFKFNPHIKKQMQSVWVENEKYMGGGYNAYFPSFYPDGDYYFFIDTKFENGYLGHPWRQEVWIFGLPLMNEIEKVAEKLGWIIVE